MILAAPVLGSRRIPLLFRLAGGLVISLVALPLVGMPTDTPDHWGGLISAFLSESVIGSMFGLGVLIIYSAAQFVGTIVGQMAGLQVDAFSGAETSGQSTTGRLFAMVSAAVFVLIGGPEMMIASVLDSFQTLPVGSPVEPHNLLETCITLLQQSFLLALKAVAPAMGALMVATIVVGMLSLSLPQINILQVGLSSNLIVMMLAIFFTLGGCIWLFVDDLQSSIQYLQEALRNAA